MTVTYTAEVATSHFGTFWRLLLRWKGSVYKLLWVELLVFIIAYYAISFIYRFALPEHHKRNFEKISIYCELYNNLIPMAFVLGFYVSIVVTRWWEEFICIPWPDKMALYVTANIHGHDDRGRLIRRTIMRYVCLSFVMTVRAISTAVKKRFPTDDHLTEAGLQTENEQKIIEGVKTNNNKYFVPMVWATSLINRARSEGRIKDDFAMKTLVEEVNNVRGQLGGLLNYDWVNVPLIYTQVVTLAVYTFFLSCLMGRQILDPAQGYDNHQIDIYVPIFTILQFIFYMGWLKVAESLLNPFGEDDDDFEMNWLIDRNLQVAYLIVDEMHSEHPDLIKDQFWDEADFTLPYNAASEQFRIQEPHVGSAADVEVPEHASEFVPLASIPEEATHATSTPQNVPRKPLSSKTINSSYRRQIHKLNMKNSEIFEGHSPRSLTSQPEEGIFAMSDLSVEKAGAADLDATSDGDLRFEGTSFKGGNPSERTLTRDSVQNVTETRT